MDLPTDFCAHLRNKTYHVKGRAAALAEDFDDRTGHTWCAKTAGCMGPDACPTSATDCRDAQRPCHQSSLPSLT